MPLSHSFAYPTLSLLDSDSTCDWKLMNDTKNLQRINIQPEKVPVFHFYSPYVVEEKVLSLSKQVEFL